MSVLLFYHYNIDILAIIDLFGKYKCGMISP